ncbi:hypothetical protein [Clostridium arbusti]|uniref:hypothetical protein n=1 Tax=Clostridium arbusti TaxID=1137848 RepID=UPI0003014FC8|nr:hypothetical protein [Clostridium arbusti]
MPNSDKSNKIDIKYIAKASKNYNMKNYNIVIFSRRMELDFGVVALILIIL